MHGQKGESSEAIRGRVLAARAIQRERFKHTRIHTNNQMSNRHVKQFCPLKPDAEGILAHAMEELTLSARAYNKILKVSRTIADLAGSALGSVAEGSADIQSEHVSEAIQYRSLDRNLWV